MEELVEVLKSKKIPIFEPGNVEYERSVATANLLYRFARPACVVQPERTSQVQTVIRETKSRGISITIKNGGHSYAGFSTASKDISLDLLRMRDVNLDMASGLVTMQGGAQWGHAYRMLVNGRHDGYIINGGRCPTVGVSGFILGGGLSPFTRSFGMGCDTLKEATIVTADGNVVTVKDTDDRRSNKGRLFWALCGAGGGNFGVVVEMKLRVQRLQNEDGNIVAGRFTWMPNTIDADFMETMNSFYTADWPTRMTIDSSWLCDLQQTRSELAVRFIVCYDGNTEDFEQVVDKYVKQTELSKQLKRRSLPEKSSRFLHETLVAQWSEETIKAFPSSRSYSIYTSFVFMNDRASMEKITSIIREQMKAFRRLFQGETALLQVTWIHSGGKASDKKRSASAFRWRDGVYHSYIMIQWNEKFLERDMRGFLGEFKKELKPFSMMRRAVFINFPDGALQSSAHERAYYGNNRQELQRIKAIWDKDNFFNWVHGVRLPPRKARMGASTSYMETAGDIDENDENPAADEELVDEQALADVIATQQWESVTLPPRNAFVGGIHALTDLGF
jgi:FAD/FMN-containing dehydrogenase